MNLQKRELVQVCVFVFVLMTLKELEHAYGHPIVSIS